MQSTQLPGIWIGDSDGHLNGGSVDVRTASDMTYEDPRCAAEWARDGGDICPGCGAESYQSRACHDCQDDHDRAARRAAEEFFG